MDKYKDIINLEHYEPKHHVRMSKYQRAAQFAPFAALTGYDEEVKETARMTDKRIVIDAGLRSILNDKLLIIKNNINDNPEISFTYFVNDAKKSGGKYITISGLVKRIDEVNGYVKLVDNTLVPIKDIIDIKGEILKQYYN